MSPYKLALTLTIIAFSVASAQAGTNDFFGSSVGGAGEQQGAMPTGDAGGTGSAVNSALMNSNPGAATGLTAAENAMNNPSDFTVDEKRVQKKYRANVAQAQKLIAKGQDMMKSHNPKEAKKGQIFKEIGERRLAELRANNPFPEIAERPHKKVN